MGLYRKKPTLNELYADLPTLFSGLTIPAALDSSTMKALILQELGELETVFLKAADLAAYLTYWSTIHAVSWNRMYAALIADYNPIHNYDRTDTESETTSGSGTENRSHSDTDESSDTSASQFSGTTQGSGSDSTANDVAGFNSATYSASSKDTTTLGSKQDSTSATVGSGSTKSEKSGNEDVTRSEAESRSRTLNSSGNIGVTTSQQMITAEIELRSKWTIYGMILQAFRSELCVGVW